VQGLLRDVTAIEQKLAFPLRDGSPGPHGTPDSCPGKIAFANGRRLSDNAFQNLTEDDFDLILDMTTHTVEYRKDPAKPTPLLSSPVKGIGYERLRVLAFMIEHPTRRLCSDTVPSLVAEPDYVMERGALAQTVRLLRRSLGAPGRQNPYILTEPAWGESRRRGACVYVLNPRWRYIDPVGLGNQGEIIATSEVRQSHLLQLPLLWGTHKILNRRSDEMTIQTRVGKRRWTRHPFQEPSIVLPCRRRAVRSLQCLPRR
jgi:hypothetical protein